MPRINLAALVLVLGLVLRVLVLVLGLVLHKLQLFPDSASASSFTNFNFGLGLVLHKLQRIQYDSIVLNGFK